MNPNCHNCHTVTTVTIVTTGIFSRLFSLSKADNQQFISHQRIRQARQKWSITSANPPLQACQTWYEARNVCCFCSQKSPKTCTCPSFQYFSLSWNRTQVTQNSRIPTKNGRKCAVWWAIWWQIGGAGKGQLSWLLEEPSAATSDCTRRRSSRSWVHAPGTQHARDGDGQACVRRLPQDRQVDHLTRGKAHRRLPGRTVGKPGLLNSMWNRMETYGIVLNRMIATCACRTFVVWLESAQKISFPVGEKYFSNWRDNFELRTERIKNFEFVGIMNYDF